jgi:hypothetical protein
VLIFLENMKRVYFVFFNDFSFYSRAQQQLEKEEGEKKACDTYTISNNK